MRPCRASTSCGATVNAEAIVVDTSVIVDALVGADGKELRAQLLSKDMHAPSLIDYEVMSALRGLALGGHVSEQRAWDAVDDFFDLRIRRASLGPMAQEVWRLRHRVTAYDAAYAALADMLGVPLWTRDRRLAEAVPGVHVL